MSLGFILASIEDTAQNVTAAYVRYVYICIHILYLFISSWVVVWMELYVCVCVWESVHAWFGIM